MSFSLSCPILNESLDCITLAHGSGGKETSRLIETVFQPAFSNQHLDAMHDGAVLPRLDGTYVFTTDSYVIEPLVFPGGNIGTLAVTGTINDLAMCGAKPLYLSCSFIIEEGLPIATLQHIVDSMASCAREQSVLIVTGDTKVVERQTGKNLFITTSGIGKRLTSYTIDPHHICENDAIIVSGDIGRHGMTIMAEREDLVFETPLQSDSAPLSPIVEALLKAEIPIHCLRDATRGGVATTLVELSEASSHSFSISESSIPVLPVVQNACEILGLDPMFVANEGCFILCLPKEYAEKAIEIIQAFPQGTAAALIGEVESRNDRPRVKMQTALGSSRFIQKLVGDQLPRIC